METLEVEFIAHDGGTSSRQVLAVPQALMLIAKGLARPAAPKGPQATRSLAARVPMPRYQVRDVPVPLGMPDGVLAYMTRMRRRA
jgi:hypothetical protein